MPEKEAAMIKCPNCSIGMTKTDRDEAKRVEYFHCSACGQRCALEDGSNRPFKIHASDLPSTDLSPSLDRVRA